MKCAAFFSLLGVLLVGCVAVPSDKAVESTARVKSATENTLAASVSVRRFADDEELAAFSMPDADKAVLKKLLGQGRPSVYEPEFLSPAAPPYVQAFLCIGAFKLNLEYVWSESREASELAWLEKCEGAGRIGPQIVLPDSAYEQFMSLDSVRQARETVKGLEENN